MEQNASILENEPVLAVVPSATGKRDGGVFIGFIILGVGGLFFLPALTSGSSSAMIRNMSLWLLPLLVAGYGAWGYWLSGLQNQADTRQRFADNIYFLGFIFTMGSLIASFLPVAFTGGNPSVNEIYRAFGTALLSTALGLILRVLVMQYGPSADETAAQAEEDLVSLTRRVAEEARQIGEALATARRGLIRHNDDMVKAILSATGKRLDAVVGEFDVATKSASELLRLQAEDTRAEAETLRKRINVRSTDIVEAAGLLAEARGRVTSALDGLAQPVEQLGVQLTATSAAASETALRLRGDVASLAEALAAAMSGTERMARALSDFETGAGRQLERVDSAIKGLETASSQSVERIKVASAETVGEMQRLTTGLTTESRQLRQQGGDFQQSLDAANARFAAIVNDFAARLERLRTELDANGSRP